MPAPSCAPVSLPRAQRCLSIPTQPPISASVLELAWHLEREAPAASHAARPQRVSWAGRAPRRGGGGQGGGPPRAPTRPDPSVSAGRGDRRGGVVAARRAGAHRAAVRTFSTVFKPPLRAGPSSRCLLIGLS